MGSVALSGFRENKKDLDRLAEIHRKLAGKGPGRKRGVDVLNRASIVFVAACWESFVEDLAKEASECLLDCVVEPERFPVDVRLAVSEPLRQCKDSRAVWDLAGEGWKRVVRKARDETIAAFHTPKAAKVDELYLQLLGLKRVSRSWAYNNVDADKAADRLDKYVTVRGNIAHRIKHDESVHKRWVTQFLEHAERLAGLTEARVSDHLKELTAKIPW